MLFDDLTPAEARMFDAAVLDGADRLVAEACDRAMRAGIDGIPVLLRLIVMGGA